MSVGLPELDDDHRGLIAILNQLAKDRGDADRAAAVRQCIVALRRYAEAHFAREESVLSACGYRAIEQHKEEHEDFIQKIKEVGRKIDEDPDGASEQVSQALLNFLKDWLNHHILIEDMAYRPTIQDRPEAKKAARAFSPSEIWWSV